MSEIQSQKRPSSELNAEIELTSNPIEQPKRQKVTFIEEDLLAADLSELLTSLEQELSRVTDGESVSGASVEDEVESVMKRLAEASDDELGIPNAAEESGDWGVGVCSGFLWELEDEIANHYTLLPLELFL